MDYRFPGGGQFGQGAGMYSSEWMAAYARQQEDEHFRALLMEQQRQQQEYIQNQMHVSGLHYNQQPGGFVIPASAYNNLNNTQLVPLTMQQHSQALPPRQEDQSQFETESLPNHVPSTDSTVYCSCQKTEDESDGALMMECADGKGGCNGWFHPVCEGLTVSPEEATSMTYVCKLCRNSPQKISSRQQKFKKRKRDRSRGTEQGEDGPSTSHRSPQAVRQTTSRGRRTKTINYAKQLQDDDEEEDEEEEEESSSYSKSRQTSSSILAEYSTYPPGVLSSSLIPPPPGKRPLPLIVERILSWQPYQQEEKQTENTEKEAAAAAAAEEEDFWLVKWKDRSYLHTSWETKKGLLLHDAGAEQKIKRFEQNMLKLKGVHWRTVMQEEIKERGGPELPDPELTEVQRVVACEHAQVNLATIARQLRRERAAMLLQNDGNSTDEKKDKETSGGSAQEGVTAIQQEQPPVQPINNLSDLIEKRFLEAKKALEEKEDEEQEDIYYLIKWRGLPYVEASWEKWSDLKDWAVEEVAHFWLWQRPDVSRVNPILYGAAAAGGDMQQDHILRDLQQGLSPKFGHPSRTFLSTYDPQGPSDLEETSDEGLELRDYQLTGLRWLLFNFYQKRPSILADEMGLGKTIQTMTFLTSLFKTPGAQTAGPYIIVAPLSLINQWESEAMTWAPDMNVLVYYGNSDSRQVIRDYEFYYNEPYVNRQDADVLKQYNVTKFDVLLTTYEVMIKDVRLLGRIRWKVLVVDEAHRLKNPASKLFMELRNLPREHCVLLTGTPLQNKTEELWALLHFADPVHFNDPELFSREYGDLKDASQVESLHNMLKPFLLRRIKEDVEKSLPPKEETIIEVSLTPLQRKFYMAIYDRNTAFLFKETKPSMAPSLMNVMMELRKCCNHAFLNRGVEDRILSEIPVQQRTPENLHNQLVACSGKMVLLDKLLPRLKAEGHKVLIFSQMVRVLDLVEDYMRYMGHSYERLDGSKRAQDRSAAVLRFNNPALGRFVMLLSTRAGGLGLNLTSADTVIIYDSDWNPHNDLQAQARAHRIGQTKAVKVYRLLTRKSYELEMFHAASMKLGLDRAVLAHARAAGAEEGGEEKTGAADTDKAGKRSTLLEAAAGKKQVDFNFKEVEHLLKRGAYDVFRGDDTEGQEFQEADIDQIMQRQSHKVVYGNNESLTKNLTSSFSKASFVSVDNKEDIDLDDPEFWKKAIGLSGPTPGENSKDAAAESLIIHGDRKRKRRERFDSSLLFDLEGLEDSPFEDGDNDSDDDSSARSSTAASSVAPKRRGRPPKPGGSTRRRRRQGGGNEMGTQGALPATTEGRPAVWGQYTRDRVIRALLQFGFGRWEKIRQDANVLEHELAEVESFCRSFVLQCGLSAGKGRRYGRESKFVRDAIAAAVKLSQQMKNGEIIMPEILQEERFSMKLREGLARKSLIRLDILLRLQTSLIHDAVLRALAKLSPEMLIARNIFPDSLPNMPFQEKVEVLEKAEIAAEIHLGDVRPSWAKLAAWWDQECDKHLLLGTYVHGFMNYARIRTDADLCFTRKMEAWMADNSEKMTVTQQSLQPGPGTNSVVLVLGSHKIDLLAPDYAWPPVTITVNVGGGGKKPQREGEEEEEEGKDEVVVKRTVTLPGKRLSQYRGVYSQPGSILWVAQIQLASKIQCLGFFESEKEAALCYDQHARATWGEAAATCNFQPDGEKRNPDVQAETGLSLLWHRSSRYRGVRATGYRWTAQISYKGVNHHLGTFNTEVEAALAYDEMSHKHHSGGSAIFNFGEEEGGIQKCLDDIDRIMSDLEAKALPGSMRYQPKEEIKEETEESGMVADNTNEGDEEKIREAEPLIKIKGEDTVVLTQSSEIVGKDDDHRMDEHTEIQKKADILESKSESLEMSENLALKKEQEVDVAMEIKTEVGSVSTAAVTTNNPTITADSTSDVVTEKEVIVIEDEEDEKTTKEKDTDAIRKVEEATLEGGDEEEEEDLAGSKGEDTQKYFWPESKWLNKLVNWLIDDPQATMSREEVQAMEIERKKTKLEEERVKMELIAQNQKMRIEAAHEAAKLKQQPDTHTQGQRQHHPPAGEGKTMLGYNRRPKNAEGLLVNGKWSLEATRRLIVILFQTAAPLPSNNEHMASLYIAPEVAEVAGCRYPLYADRSQIGMTVEEEEGQKEEPRKGGGGYMQTIRWSDIGQRMNMMDVEAFYFQLLLPSLQKLAEAPKEAFRDFVADHEKRTSSVVEQEEQQSDDGKGTHESTKTTAAAEQLPALALFPDPYRPLSEHSLQARSIACMLLRRQQLFRAIRYVIEVQFQLLLSYLQSPEAGNYENMDLPSWWMAGKHDLALIIASCRHGLVLTEEIRKDELSGLSDEALVQDILSNRQDAALMTEEQVKKMVHDEFPAKKVLEERLHRICVALCKKIPSAMDLGQASSAPAPPLDNNEITETNATTATKPVALIAPGPPSHQINPPKLPTVSSNSSLHDTESTSHDKE